MGSLDELLTLTRIGVVEGSEFYSSHGADLQAARKFLEQGIPDGGIPAKKILEAAHPTLSQIVVYELGCGLRILVPESADGARLTSMEEAYAKEGAHVEYPTTGIRILDRLLGLTPFFSLPKSDSEYISPEKGWMAAYYLAPETPTRDTTRMLRWALKIDPAFNPVGTKVLRSEKQSADLFGQYMLWIKGLFKTVAETNVKNEYGKLYDIEYAVKLREGKFPPEVQEFNLLFDPWYSIRIKDSYRTKYKDVEKILINIRFDDYLGQYEACVFQGDWFFGKIKVGEDYPDTITPGNSGYYNVRGHTQEEFERGYQVKRDGRGEEINVGDVLTHILALDKDMDKDTYRELMCRLAYNRFDPEYQAPEKPNVEPESIKFDNSGSSSSGSNQSYPEVMGPLYDTVDRSDHSDYNIDAFSASQTVSPTSPLV